MCNFLTVKQWGIIKVPSEFLKSTDFLDFSLLLQQNSYDGLVSSGMPAEMLQKLYMEPTSVLEKWKIVEPYWNKSFNTISNRILLLAIKDLYRISELNLIDSRTSYGINKKSLFR